MNRVLFRKSLLTSISLIIFTGSLLPAAEKLVTISSYTTSIEDQDASVKTNITLAATKLNNIIIHPGEVFSFNKTVGEGSASNGYLTGRVLYQDMTAYEPGGGICQVSSTLFNALVLSGCSIVERHRHSNPVRYVPTGLDATIRYGKKDLRMKNSTGLRLYIFTIQNNKSLTIIIKSENRPPYIYEIFTEEEGINLPFADKKGREIRNGISIYVYRKKLLNEKVIENILLYKDFYPPVYIER